MFNVNSLQQKHNLINSIACTNIQMQEPLVSICKGAAGHTLSPGCFVESPSCHWDVLGWHRSQCRHRAGHDSSPQSRSMVTNFPHPDHNSNNTLFQSSSPCPSNLCFPLCLLATMTYISSGVAWSSSCHSIRLDKV